MNKKIIFLFCITSLLFGDNIEKANEAFRLQDYKKALELYQKEYNKKPLAAIGF